MSKLIKWSEVQIGDIIQFQDVGNAHWEVLKFSGAHSLKLINGDEFYTRLGSLNRWLRDGEPDRTCTLHKRKLKLEVYKPSRRQICLKDR